MELKHAIDRLLRGHQAYDHCATERHRKEAWNRDACTVARALGKILAEQELQKNEAVSKALNFMQLQNLVKFLKDAAGEDDMASVQITSDGGVILRVGLSNSEYISLEKLVEEMAKHEA